MGAKHPATGPSEKIVEKTPCISWLCIKVDTQPPAFCNGYVRHLCHGVRALMLVEPLCIEHLCNLLIRDRLTNMLYLVRIKCARVAQWIEQAFPKRCVRGSIPLVGLNFISCTSLFNTAVCPSSPLCDVLGTYNSFKTAISIL